MLGTEHLCHLLLCGAVTVAQSIRFPAIGLFEASPVLSYLASWSVTIFGEVPMAKSLQSFFRLRKAGDNHGLR